MKTASLVSGVLALLFGIGAAYFWFRSTKEGPSFAFLRNFMRDDDGTTALDRHQAAAARDNRIASILSGLTAFFGGIRARKQHHAKGNAAK